MQNPGSVSGPTSSGSFALTLIRGSPQRTIHGPVRLARRPASHPPDQRQGSAVTYVALRVVSDIAVKKRFFNYRATLRVACRSGRSASSLWRFTSHSGSAKSVMFVYGSRHLSAPRRLTLKDQSKQNPGSVSGPTSSGSFALTLIRRRCTGPSLARCSLLGVLPRIPRINVRAQPSLTSHSASSVISRYKSAFVYVQRLRARRAVVLQHGFVTRSVTRHHDDAERRTIVKIPVGELAH